MTQLLMKTAKYIAMATTVGTVYTWAAVADLTLWILKHRIHNEQIRILTAGTLAVPISLGIFAAALLSLYWVAAAAAASDAYQPGMPLPPPQYDTPHQYIITCHCNYIDISYNCITIIKAAAHLTLQTLRLTAYHLATFLFKFSTAVDR